MKTTIINLKKDFFSPLPLEIISAPDFSAEIFIYETGIHAVKLKNSRGHLIILPYYGQIIWAATFDNVDLTMQSRFKAPRYAQDIVGTYGCFMYHSGLLHNGNPSAEDTHALHGEMPLASINQAWIEMGEDQDGPWLALVGSYEYLMGFGDHYIAQPRVVIRPDSALFDVHMNVNNLAVDPMNLMYMCHANFAYTEGGRIIQPASFSAQDTVIRSSVPAIVKSNDIYLNHLAKMKEDPSATEYLDSKIGFDPELVFYLKNLKKASDGNIHVMMRRPSGDAFSVVYDPTEYAYLVRWILANNKQKVCAFAMPATCGVEGYTTEKALGNVRTLESGQTVNFKIRLGYLNEKDAAIEETLIRDSH
jgi:hypothetical protein